MRRLCAGLLVLSLALPVLSRAADPPLTLHSAQGTISKVDAKKGTLVVQPTSPDGKPGGKPIELTITGTSDFFMVGTQKTGNKVSIRQRKIEAADLKPKQVVSVTYTKMKNEMILLYTVALPMD
jgi:hypothetical protein